MHIADSLLPEWVIEVSTFTETGIGYRDIILLVVALVNLVFCLSSIHMVMVGSRRSVDCAGGPGNHGSGCFRNGKSEAASPDRLLIVLY